MWQQVSWTMHTCTMLGQPAHSSFLLCSLVGDPLGDVKPRSSLCFWCRSLQEPFQKITQNCSLNQMKGRVRDTSAALEKWGIGQWQRTRCSKYQVQHTTTLQTLSLPVVLWTSFPTPRLPAYSQTFTCSTAWKHLHPQAAWQCWSYFNTILLSSLISDTWVDTWLFKYMAGILLMSNNKQYDIFLFFVLHRHCYWAVVFQRH